MKSDSYYMGWLVGDYILCKYLPTLETDMIQTNNRISIPDESERSENFLLKSNMEYHIFSEDINKDENYSNAHRKWLEHTNMLAKKYLPEKLECSVAHFNVSKVSEFKEGLTDYLYDCDVSWYLPQDDFLPDSFGGWYRNIILTRTV